MSSFETNESIQKLEGASNFVVSASKSFISDPITAWQRRPGENIPQSLTKSSTRSIERLFYSRLSLSRS